MRVRINPYTNTGKAVEAPPSKSMAHRHLICAGLAEGTSRISNIAMSDDIRATLDCLLALGAEISQTSDSMTLKVKGKEPFPRRELLMPCGESGSTLRFMIPVCALTGASTLLTGKGRLMQRPVSVYEKILKEQGLYFEQSDTAIQIKGQLRGGEFCMPGNISSQFVSGLLFALPLCREDSIIRIEGSVQSRPYIDMTVKAQQEHGISVSWKDDATIEVGGGQRYRPADTTIEGDWSNAANLMAVGAEVTGLDPASIQGDRICAEYFRMLDEGPAEIDITDCPDLGPVLMAYAALRQGAVLRGTERLRYKESDRGAAMQEELSKFGIETCIYENTITVGCGVSPPDDVLQGHNDHRIVMALAAICAKTGGCIDGAEAVRKSFPDYFEKLCELGVDIVKES